MENEIITAQYEKYKEQFDQILDKIKSYDRIAIFRHIMPDFDALGSQFGLYYFLKENFPNKEFKVLGDNHVTFTPNGLFPETDKLNDSWFNEDFLGIIVDVGDEKRIADPRFKRAKELVKLDHHPITDTNFTIDVTDTSLAAAAELVASFICYLENKYNYKLKENAAHYLYIGIVGDSGRFLFGSTSRHTFEISSYLLSKGINIVPIYEKMYEKGISDLEFQKFILNNYKISKAGTAYYVLKDSDLKELGLSSEQGKEHVNLFSAIKGVNIWCSITEDTTEPCFRISLRSRYYDVSKIARKYKGGGHISASGAQIDTLDDLDKFIQDCDETILNSK